MTDPEQVVEQLREQVASMNRALIAAGVGADSPYDGTSNIELAADTISSLIEERDALLAEVREWVCEDCNFVYPGPPQPGVKCIVCPHCGGGTGPRPNIERRKVEADLFASLERETALKREAEALSKALREIAERSCGIPGHAVAVGCGASVIAQKALEGEFVRFCPDCNGRGARYEFSESFTSIPCETCHTSGLVAASLPTPEQETP